MALAEKVKVLNYLYRFLIEQRKDILSYTLEPKPTFDATVISTNLPRSSAKAEGIDNRQIANFFADVTKSTKASLHGVVIVKNGRVINKTMYQPYRENIWNTTHSLAKTITALAVGFAVDEGLLAVDNSIYELLLGTPTFFTSNNVKQLTVKHLLTMTSGVNFREVSIVASDNWTESFFKSDFQATPGTEFDYNSLNTYILAKILFEKTGETLLDYLKPRLLEPLGIKAIASEKSAEGVDKAGWGMYVTLEDMAKLGLLILQKGRWLNGTGEMQQLLSEAWVAEMVYPHVPDARETKRYGYQIWLGKTDNYYCMNGLFGQHVYINPEENLVVATTAGLNYVFIDEDVIEAIHRNLCGKGIVDTNTEDISETVLAQQLGQLRYKNYKLLAKDTITVPAPELPTEKKTFFEKLRAFFKEEKSTVEQVQFPQILHKISNIAYEFPDNVAGILPLIVQAMNNNFSQGVERVDFTIEGNDFVLHWQERGQELLSIPIGIYQPTYATIRLGREQFEIATYGILTTDEDDNFVLKIEVLFLETSSTRTIKCFYMTDTNECILKFDEQPSISCLMDNLVEQVGSGDIINFLGKDNFYYNVLLGRVSTPKVYGNECPE